MASNREVDYEVSTEIMVTLVIVTDNPDLWNLPAVVANDEDDWQEEIHRAFFAAVYSDLEQSLRTTAAEQELFALLTTAMADNPDWIEMRWSGEGDPYLEEDDDA